MTAHLEQEIRDLESAIGVLTHRIQVLYLEYAQVVAQAARKQLILSTFNVCTRHYPTFFLALSPPDRQSLQSSVVAVADRLQAHLVELFRAPLTEQSPDDIDRLLNQTLDEFTSQVNLILSQKGVLPKLTEDAPRVFLRLQEIEFTDRSVMSQRGELRVLCNRREQLKLDLEQKRQKKLTIDAEEAWRSTWTENL